MQWLALTVLMIGADYPRAELLVEPSELVSRQTGNGWVILDARDKKAYLAGHIPGALWVDHAAWAKGFGQGKDIQGWSNRIGTLGISNNQTVLIYDDNMAKDAARIWWILKYFGLKDARILNGGWKGWTAAKGQVETIESQTKAIDFTPQIQNDRYSSKQSILESLNGKSLQIIDARSEKEHCGLDPLSNARAGSIPGARHLEWSDLLDPKTQRFREAGQIKDLFAKAGIDLEKPSATHCQSGGRASVMAFGMELMGAPKVSNYYSGWSEWGNQKDLPLEKPMSEKPKPEKSDQGKK